MLACYYLGAIKHNESNCSHAISIKVPSQMFFYLLRYDDVDISLVDDSDLHGQLEMVVKETDAGEDWRVDPVLHEACLSVVESACKDIRGGNAR